MRAGLGLDMTGPAPQVTPLVPHAVIARTSPQKPGPCTSRGRGLAILLCLYGRFLFLLLKGPFPFGPLPFGKQGQGPEGVLPRRPPRHHAPPRHPLPQPAPTPTPPATPPSVAAAGAPSGSLGLAWGPVGFPWGPWGRGSAVRQCFYWPYRQYPMPGYSQYPMPCLLPGSTSRTGKRAWLLAYRLL